MDLLNFRNSSVSIISQNAKFNNTSRDDLAGMMLRKMLEIEQVLSLFFVASSQQFLQASLLKFAF